MKIFKSTKEEFKNIFSNKIKFIAFLAVIIIPLLYSFFYLKAYWDPYGNLQGYSIAIVNSDKGIVEDGEKSNYGNDVIDNLKDNKDIGFKYVSFKEAKEGLDNEEYFAAFFIPEDFSKKIIDARKGKAVPPTIEYFANDKKNYIGSKISKTVQGEIKEKIKKNISKEYGEVAFESIYELKDGLNEAVDGTKQLLDGQDKLKDGTDDLNKGMDKVNNKMPELSSGFGKLYNGMISLDNGVNSPDGLKAGTSKLFGGLEFAYSGSNELNAGISKAYNGADDLYKGISKLDMALNTEAKDQSGKPLGLKNGALALESGINKLNDSINTQAKDQNGKPLGLKEGMKSLNQGINVLNQKINGNDGLVQGVNNIYDGSKVLSQTVDNLDKVLEAYKANPDAQTLAQIETIVKGLKYSTSQNSQDPQKPTLKDGIDGLRQGVNKLAQSTDKGIVPAASSITKGVETLASSVSNEVVPATKGVSGGVQQLSDTVKTQAVTGAGQLKGGLKDLNAGSQSLNSGVEQLYTASGDMVKGVNTLSSGSHDIKNGMTEFNGQIPTLTSGIGKLFEGSKELQNGMDELKSGTEELKDGLEEGIDKVNKNVTTPSKELGEFVGEPVKVKENTINPVPNYGTGLAPYFLPISSWLGAVFMFFVLKPKKKNEEEYNTIQRVLGSYVTYALIGIIQAIALGGIVLVLGIKPSSIPMMFVTNVCMSLCFVAIIQCLTSLLGLAGEGLAIVILVLQLCSDSGTFPIETLPQVFKSISTFFPFTYCVQMIREVLSATNINYSLVMKDIGILAIFTVAFMAVNMIFNKKGQVVSEGLEEKLAA